MAVAYNQAVDTHTTLVSSSIVARPDTYNAIGNVRIDINRVATLVLNNQSDGDTLILLGDPTMRLR